MGSRTDRPLVLTVAFLATSLLAIGPDPAPAADVPAEILEESSTRRVLEVSMTAASSWRAVRGGLSNTIEKRRRDGFLVHGSIYRPGTIPSGDGVFGPEEPGRMGIWTSRAVHVDSEMEPVIAAGAVPHVIATQVFLLPEAASITAEGPFLGTLNEGWFEGGLVARRAIVGGTGRCAGARGDVMQETLGMSGAGLFNVRYTFLFTHLPANCRLPRG